MVADWSAEIDKFVQHNPFVRRDDVLALLQRARQEEFDYFAENLGHLANACLHLAKAASDKRLSAELTRAAKMTKQLIAARGANDK